MSLYEYFPKHVFPNTWRSTAATEVFVDNKSNQMDKNTLRGGFCIPHNNLISCYPNWLWACGAVYILNEGCLWLLLRLLPPTSAIWLLPTWLALQGVSPSRHSDMQTSPSVKFFQSFRPPAPRSPSSISSSGFRDHTLLLFLFISFGHTNFPIFLSVWPFYHLLFYRLLFLRN